MSLTIGRMIDQTGGYSAGVYDIGHPNYNQTNDSQPSALHTSKPGERTLELEYVVDEITGDVRIRKKE